MKIEDLVQLLNNRLREFKLSRDYARMSGDLERMNTADKEVIALEDTLYKLNLLVDTSKSAAVKDAILAEVMTDGSVAVLGEYDITPYATDPLHEEKIMNILSKMGVMDTVEKIDEYIRGKSLSSPVTGEMVMSASLAYEVDARLMMAMMEQDSRFGTLGVAVRTLNPGNVGNNDDGDTVTYESWQEGVTAVAEWLNRHRISKIISETPLETVVEPTATSTSSGQATSTSAFDSEHDEHDEHEHATSTSTLPCGHDESEHASTFDCHHDESEHATSTPTLITPTTSTSTPVTSTTTPTTPNQDSLDSSGTGQAATSTPTTTPEPEPEPEPDSTSSPQAEPLVPSEVEGEPTATTTKETATSTAH